MKFTVSLFTAGHGDEPILIDKSPPIPGIVLDGDRLHQDRQYQSEDNRICAQWKDFYDPESGIDRYSSMHLTVIKWIQLMFLVEDCHCA